MSKVAVIGAGYVGLTTAACLADLGNDVTVVDIDREKIDQLQHRHIPFYEPGMLELVSRNADSHRLRFTTSYRDAIPGAEYAIIAVSTPEGEGGEADLSYVEAAAASIAEAMTGPLVVVNKSTVPPLTGDMVSRVLRERNTEHEAHVVSNPEFLREGSAIQDFMHPDRVVVGGHDRGAAEKVAKLYEPLEAPILITPNIYTAEMVKYASNAFLAARISFINEIARICERVDADAKLVAEGMGLDKRIGPSYLDAGIGFGGSCFPKDVKALAALAERFDYHPDLLHAVMDINRDQRMLVIDKLRDCLDNLNEKVIGLLGLAFKPNTDDLREAPSLDIARVLLAAGARVRAYDPAAMERMQAILPELDYKKDAYEVASGADALVIVTEWNEFRHLDLSRLKTSMRKPVVIDGRNIYVPATMQELGFTYRGIGRG
jgi:UDPglucose 6-dehydrogenase